MQRIFHDDVDSFLSLSLLDRAHPRSITPECVVHKVDFSFLRIFKWHRENGKVLFCGSLDIFLSQ